MDNSARFSIIALILLGIAGTITVGIFGTYLYNNYVQQKNQVGVLQQEINSLKNQKPVPQVTKIIKSPPAPKDMASIISEWRPLISYIQCTFYDNGQPSISQGGSGTLNFGDFPTSDASGNLTGSTTGVNIITNAHVVTGDGKYLPHDCIIHIPNQAPILLTGNLGKNISVSSDGYDAAILNIDNPSASVLKLAHPLKTCNSLPLIGDQVVVLGYPAIGSSATITATDGIISGFDGDYFVTSAKVEHGNSGGAAILVKNDCYLGIPSFVDVGSVESLARILDGRVILENK